MKLTIKVRKINKNLPLPRVIQKGEWVDLRAATSVNMIAPQAGTLKRKINIKGEEIYLRDVSFSTSVIPLGVAMKLPEGFEAVVLPRSGTFKNFGVIMANSEGVIDNSYSGNTDEWKFPAIALKATDIMEGDRICQFRIQLSQKATIWQKLKWTFSSGIEIVEVESLGEINRGGFGTTGIA